MNAQGAGGVNWQKWAVIVALVVGLPGAVLAWQQLNDRSAGGAESSDQAPAAKGDGPTEPGADRPSPAKVRWNGQLLLSVSTDDMFPPGADLDADPPNNEAEEGGDVTLDIAYGYVEVPGKSLHWTDRAAPTPERCAAKMRTHGVSEHTYNPSTPGMRICLETDGGRIAVVQLKNTPKYADNKQSVDLTATVWQSVDG